MNGYAGGQLREAIDVRSNKNIR